MSHPDLDGKRVLVVEDELLIAVLIEEMLEEAGCVVIGPFARVAEAIVAARAETVDVALLDVNVAGELVFPVAHELERRGIPFLFATGYGQSAMPRQYANWQAHSKPFQLGELVECLARKVRTV